MISPWLKQAMHRLEKGWEQKKKEKQQPSMCATRINKIVYPNRSYLELLWQSKIDWLLRYRRLQQLIAQCRELPWFLRYQSLNPKELFPMLQIPSTRVIPTPSTEIATVLS
jgi:hypothetical protein